MSMPEISPILRAWYRWKMLRLPWRKRFLVGLDLRGNTYWTFLDKRADKHADPRTLRWRRIVQYPRSAHLSDVTVPPQWHQWLRHQREEPPSLADQAADVARQSRIKALAAEADARWEAKPRLSDMPGAAKGQPQPALDTGRTQPQEQAAEQKMQDKGLRDGAAAQGKTEVQDDPWKKAATGPGETWQPAAWTPTSTRKR
ncbi:hypothetical protein KJ359_008417 [Pestalotiopsis sp. 9143b]|nr:hypothetical protein KJ359_008417 [Pestalotiopsis sp. 9143b]